MNPRSVVPLFLMIALLAAATGCTQAGTGSASAVPSTTPTITTPPSLTANETLVAFVKEAVAYAGANGKDAALAEFNRPNGSFARGELYIYAYDFNGTTIAHPFNPEKIGVNRINETRCARELFHKRSPRCSRERFRFCRILLHQPGP